MIARLSLVLALLVSAQAQTQMEMNDKACAGYKKADADLNRIYERILSVNAKDTDFVKALAPPRTPGLDSEMPMSNRCIQIPLRTPMEV